MPFHTPPLLVSSCVWEQSWSCSVRRYSAFSTPCLPSALHLARRGIVQSTGSTSGYQGGSAGIRSLLDQFTDHQKARRLACNARGNAYRYQRKLWPSFEAMEAAMTAHDYETVERTPLHLLPQSTLHASPRLEAHPDATSSSLDGGGQDPRSGLPPLLPSAPEGRPNAYHAFAPSPVDLMDQGDLNANPVTDLHSKMLQVADLEDTPLASLLPQREVHADDVDGGGAGAGAPRRCAREPAGASWDTLGLDPILVGAVQTYLSTVSPTADAAHTPTQLQARLIPALLHEDHQDVLFNTPKGSGATTALILSILQAIRSETAGMNILVAKDTMSAMRMHDTVMALGRRVDLLHGSTSPTRSAGLLVDRPERPDAPPSWLYYCTYKEEMPKCHAHLQSSLEHSEGPVRLFITTADVMCQLLFEKKMEFEAFGYLRRVYVDDVAEQIPMLPDNAPVAQVRDRLRNPLAAELLLGTLHQLAGPHIRSILQFGLVSDRLTVPLKQHLMSLCVKLASHQAVLSPVRLPSTIHCLFSSYFPSATFSHRGSSSAQQQTLGPRVNEIHSGLLAASVGQGPTAGRSSTSSTSCPSSMLLWWSTPALQKLRQTLTFAAELLWKARHKIPGRVVIFVQDGTDLLRARQALRAAGVDAKLLSEVYQNGQWSLPSYPEEANWRFLLVQQHQTIGLEKTPVPFVSHVIVTFAPASWQAYLHMANTILYSAAASRNRGWLWVITAASDSKAVREAVECMDVDFIHHHVDENLETVPSDVVDRRTKPPTLFGLDPQYAVQQHYEVQSENPDVSYQPREFFSPRWSKNKAFQMEDYTPIPTKMRSYKNARKLAADIERNPGQVVRQLQRGGMLSPTLKPTQRLRDLLAKKSA